MTLSDDAVNYFLDKTQLFRAFFGKGARANNTSVLAAMRRGCAVLTNCDEYSPSWMKHGENILDIHRTNADDLDKIILDKIGKNAQRDEQMHASRESLKDFLDSQSLLYKKSLVAK